jgi:hypothetical protein
VLYRKLADRHPTLELWLAWRRGSAGTALQEFIAQALRLAKA